MAGRKVKHTVDYFPAWNPQRYTRYKFDFLDKRVGFAALRNSSSAFISRKDVRSAVLEKCGYKCSECKSRDNLQVDHIIPVAYAFLNREYMRILNTFNNLQILCKRCNNRKKYPDEVPEHAKY